MQPIGLYQGRAVNPHVLRGQIDLENAPTTFARYATRWADVQLSNGWQNTDYGKRTGYRGAAYYIATLPTIPGQSRLSGGNPADFPLRGPAPSQWDYHVASTAGSQPNYPGGPGYVMGSLRHAGSYGG